MSSMLWLPPTPYGQLIYRHNKRSYQVRYIIYTCFHCNAWGSARVGITVTCVKWRFIYFQNDLKRVLAAALGSNFRGGRWLLVMVGCCSLECGGSLWPQIDLFYVLAWWGGLISHDGVVEARCSHPFQLRDLDIEYTVVFENIATPYPFALVVPIEVALSVGTDICQHQCLAAFCIWTSLESCKRWSLFDALGLVYFLPSWVNWMLVYR